MGADFLSVSHTQAVLAQYYPTALMSELALYTHKALLDLHNAFPNRTYIEVDNLLNLGQIIECLIQISDTRNRYVLSSKSASST